MGKRRRNVIEKQNYTVKNNKRVYEDIMAKHATHTRITNAFASKFQLCTVHTKIAHSTFTNNTTITYFCQTKPKCQLCNRHSIGFDISVDSIVWFLFILGKNSPPTVLRFHFHFHLMWLGICRLSLKPFNLMYSRKSNSAKVE